MNARMALCLVLLTCLSPAIGAEVNIAVPTPVATATSTGSCGVTVPATVFSPPPAQYNVIYVEAPITVTVTFPASEVDSLQVGLTQDSVKPYELGREVIGSITLCDGLAILSLTFNEGGGSVVQYRYKDPGGISQTVTNLYAINALRGQAAAASSCAIVGDFERVNYENDFTLLGYYKNNGYINAASTNYSPSAYMNMADQDTISFWWRELVGTMFRKDRKLTTLVISHGDNDSVVLDDVNKVQISGDGPNAKSFAQVLNGTSDELIFHSCCTGAGKAAGQNGNLLDTLSASMPGAVVCGYQYVVWEYYVLDGERIGNKLYNRSRWKAGITAGDKLYCSFIGK